MKGRDSRNGYHVATLRRLPFAESGRLCDSSSRWDSRSRGRGRRGFRCHRCAVQRLWMEIWTERADGAGVGSEIWTERAGRNVLTARQQLGTVSDGFAAGHFSCSCCNRDGTETAATHWTWTAVGRLASRWRPSALTDSLRVRRSATATAHETQPAGGL